MKILLTGANGLIGRKIYEKLSEKHQVITLDRVHSDYNVNISEYKELAKIVISEKKIDIIIHCAAVIDFKEFDVNVINTNISGTMNLTKLALEVGCQHFLYLSSVPIIGKPGNELITSETKNNPKTLYHISKLTGEYILKLYSDYMNICILRIASPVDLNMPSSRMIPFFLKKAINNQEIYINGLGNRMQTYINTLDLANCIDIIIDRKIKGIHLLDGEVFSNMEIAKMCVNIAGSNSNIVSDEFEIEEDNEKWIISKEFRNNYLNYELKYPLAKLLKEMKKI